MRHVLAATSALVCLGCLPIRHAVFDATPIPRGAEVTLECEGALEAPLADALREAGLVVVSGDALLGSVSRSSPPGGGTREVVQRYRTPFVCRVTAEAGPGERRVHRFHLEFLEAQRGHLRFTLSSPPDSTSGHGLDEVVSRLKAALKP